MTINDITDFYQFCKWVRLQYAVSILNIDEISRLLFFPDIFARQLKDDGYDDRFIKTMIGYVHRYKIDGLKNNKLPQISYNDYEDENDRSKIQFFDNRSRSRIDYGIY